MKITIFYDPFKGEYVLGHFFHPHLKHRKTKSLIFETIGFKFKGILATPPKTTPTNNKGLIRGYPPPRIQ